MRRNNAYDLERDIVYTPKSSGDKYENIHLSIKVGTERLNVEIVSEYEINDDDLDGILDSISTAILKKMRVDLYHDCDIFTLESDKRYCIKFSEDSCKAGKFEV